MVIAGHCDQNTLQYCCPLIVPEPGQGSVEFAGACEFFEFFFVVFLVYLKGGGKAMRDGRWERGEGIG